MVSSLVLEVAKDSNALRNRKYQKEEEKGWHVGTAGHRWRLFIASSSFVLLAVIFVGYCFRRGVAFAATKLQDCTALFTLNVVFEVISEVWLDWARMKTIRWFHPRQQDNFQNQNAVFPSTNPNQAGDCEGDSSASMGTSDCSTSCCNVSSVILQVNHAREEFHKQCMANGQIATFPYAGPQCWHWETSECIREIILGIGLMAVYAVNQNAFERFWDVAVISLYATDVIFLLTRWSHISPKWLWFNLLHHVLCFCCFTCVAFTWKVEPPAQLRALVLANLSNIFVAVPVIVRSFSGHNDHFYVAAFCFVGQRSIRWGGIIAVAANLSGDHFLYTANVVVSFLATACVELLDLPVQWKKLWQRRK